MESDEARERATIYFEEKGMAFKAKKKFEYKARSEDDVRARATGGNREGFLVDSVRTYTPKAGSHTVRILPPTWDDAKHYGYDVYAHYNIGPDGGAYLCLNKMKNEDCAICDERARAVKADDEELDGALKPRQRVACWVIDRDNEREGPLLWLMPWMLDREIVQQSIDKKTGVVYPLDSPEDGYDVSFERQGDGLTTKYVGVQLDRRSSPLSDEADTASEWLEYVKEHPIEDQLVYQDGEYLDKIVGDGLTVPRQARDKAADKKRGKEDDKPKRRSDKDDADDEPKKRSSSKKKIAIDDLDWDAVHEMDEDELNALAEQEGVDISDADDEDQAADIICEALDFEEPKKKPPKEENGKPSMRSRLQGLRDKARK
jgi:hypothetical protein